jgi:hypothetical protein
LDTFLWAFGYASSYTAFFGMHGNSNLSTITNKESKANKGMKRIAQKTGFPLMPSVEAVEKVLKA